MRVTQPLVAAFLVRNGICCGSGYNRHFGGHDSGWKRIDLSGKIPLISVALFSAELGELGVPGIWFPFGVGVSLSQFAYAAFDAALFGLLWQRLHAQASVRPRPALMQVLSGT